MHHVKSVLLSGALVLWTGTAPAQDSTQATAEPETATAEAALLTQAELETLMAPVALYPDTLLIQILVAATYPLDVVKADRFVLTNADMDPDSLKTSIEAEGWDPSVTVLATAFPTVLADMAEHVEWTEAVGTAMLAQSEDVLSAVQTLRDQAIETGALISGEAQAVTQDEDDNVVITPTDPEVVYVPEYNPDEVYDNTLGDALLTGALIFGTFAVIDAIFDDDDDWYDYWGCRNCGGWGGGPIIHNPDIDIDIDGDVNIGSNNRPDLGWKPDEGRKRDAQDKITARRDAGGDSKLPLDKAATRPAGADRGDALRGQLSDRTGAADISRPEAAQRLPQVERPPTRPAADKAQAIRDTSARPATAKKPAVKKPAAQKVATKKPTAKPSALKKRAPAGKTRAAADRGKAGKLKARR